MDVRDSPGLPRSASARFEFVRVRPSASEPESEPIDPPISRIRRVAEHGVEPIEAIALRVVVGVRRNRRRGRQSNRPDLRADDSVPDPDVHVRHSAREVLAPVGRHERDGVEGAPCVRLERRRRADDERPEDRIPFSLRLDEHPTDLFGTLETSLPGSREFVDDRVALGDDGGAMYDDEDDDGERRASVARAIACCGSPEVVSEMRDPSLSRFSADPDATMTTSVDLGALAHARDASSHVATGRADRDLGARGPIARRARAKNRSVASGDGRQRSRNEGAHREHAEHADQAAHAARGLGASGAAIHLDAMLRPNSRTIPTDVGGRAGRWFSVDRSENGSAAPAGRVAPPRRASARAAPSLDRRRCAPC